MNLTEEQAKEKWCPFTRAVATFKNGDDTVCASYNRAITSWELMEYTHCIASGCMAWRWEGGEFEWHADIDKNDPDGDGWEYWGQWVGSAGQQHNWRRPLGDQRKGYCGLAEPPK